MKRRCTSVLLRSPCDCSSSPCKIVMYLALRLMSTRKARRAAVPALLVIQQPHMCEPQQPVPQHILFAKCSIPHQSISTARDSPTRTLLLISSLDDVTHGGSDQTNRDKSIAPGDADNVAPSSCRRCSCFCSVQSEGALLLMS
jgi:hypothetical protein